MLVFGICIYPSVQLLREGLCRITNRNVNWGLELSGMLGYVLVHLLLPPKASLTFPPLLLLLSTYPLRTGPSSMRRRSHWGSGRDTPTTTTPSPEKLACVRGVGMFWYGRQHGAWMGFYQYPYLRSHPRPTCNLLIVELTASPKRKIKKRK